MRPSFGLSLTFIDSKFPMQLLLEDWRIYDDSTRNRKNIQEEPQASVHRNMGTLFTAEILIHHKLIILETSEHNIWINLALLREHNFLLIGDLVLSGYFTDIGRLLLLITHLIYQLNQKVPWVPQEEYILHTQITEELPRGHNYVNCWPSGVMAILISESHGVSWKDWLFQSKCMRYTTPKKINRLRNNQKDKQKDSFLAHNKSYRGLSGCMIARRTSKRTHPMPTTDQLEGSIGYTIAKKVSKRGHYLPTTDRQGWPIPRIVYEKW